MKLQCGRWRRRHAISGEAKSVTSYDNDGELVTTLNSGMQISSSSLRLIWPHRLALLRWIRLKKSKLAVRMNPPATGSICQRRLRTRIPVATLSSQQRLCPMFRLWLLLVKLRTCPSSIRLLRLMGLIQALRLDHCYSAKQQ